MKTGPETVAVSDAATGCVLLVVDGLSVSAAAAIHLACERIGVECGEIVASLDRLARQQKVTAVTTAEFYDKLVSHPKMLKAQRRMVTKSQGAQWKRERKGFRP